MSNSDPSLDSYLHYGCLITLSYNQGYFAYSNGFIDDSLYLNHSDQIEDFSQAIFRVLPQCMHTVQSELISSANAKKKSETENFELKFAENEEKLKSELKDNLDTYEGKKGKPIKFGSIVYLQHVQSHRFLTIWHEQISIVDKDSCKVGLVDFPNDDSYIKLESSYNFQKESGYIRKVDIVILEVYQENNIYCISASENYLKTFASEEKLREINASLDKRPKWQINLYFSVNLENKKIIMCSDYIWISHSEGKAIFVGSNKDTYSHVYFHSNLSNSNGLWEIENEDFRTGSFVYSERNYRIKQLSSGLYLTIEKTEKGGFTGKLSDRNHENSLWRFEQVHSKKVNSKVYSEQFYSLVNDRFNVKIQALDSNDRINCIILGFENNSSESSYLKIIRADYNSLWECQYTKSCIPILSSFANFISKYKSNPTEDPYTLIKDFKIRMDIMKKCLKNIKQFVKNKLQSCMSSTKHYGIIDKARQRNLKELGIIEILAKILEENFTEGFSLSKVLSLPTKLNKKGRIKFDKNTEKIDLGKDLNLILLKYLAITTQMIYEVITDACLDNLENQVYVYKFFEIIQKHAGYELGSTRCLTSLLKNNQTLLYKLHRSSSLNAQQSNIIDHYIWLLKKFHKNRKPHLIEFLETLCICNEQGVAASQEKIHENLFFLADSNNKVVIPTISDIEKKTLSIMLKDGSGIGENYVPLLSCFENGEIKNYNNELVYFTKLIGVFSALCKGRNYICKSSVNNWFPLNFLLESIWNVDLTLELRANFIDLLISMHIDFQPRNHLQKPELIRTQEKLTPKTYRKAFFDRHHFIQNDSGTDMMKIRSNMNKRKSEIFGLGFDKKKSEENSHFFVIKDEEFQMFSLKLKVIEYFENCNKGEYNILTVQMLKLAYWLIKFEVISLEVSVLESRKCYFSESSEFKSEKIDLYRLIKAIQGLFVFESKENFNKRTIIDLETVVATKTLEAAKKSNTKQNFDISDEPFAGYLEGIQKFLQFKAFKSIKPAKSASNEVQCKLELCKLINLCIDLRQETNLNIFIETYSTTENHSVTFIENLMPVPINLTNKKEKNNKNSASASFPPPFDPLLYIDNKIAEDILVLFYSTTNYELKSELLRIVLKAFNQRRALVKNLKMVKVMSMVQDPDLVLWCKVNIATFKSFSEQSEIICKYWLQTPNTSKKNIEKLDNLIELLRKFRSIMFIDCKLIEDDLSHESSKIDKHRQIMLKNLNFHEYAIKLIKESMYILEEIYDNPKSVKEKEAKLRLIKLFTECFNTLKNFTLKNEDNQKLLFQYLKVFTKNLRIQIGQIDLLCSIFQDNSELCGLTPEGLLWNFIDLIETEGRQADFLNFYDTVTVVNGVGIPNIQRFILMLLTNSDKEGHILYISPERKFQFTEKKLAQNVSYVDQPYAYHTKLISVLTKCGLSSKSFEFIKAKCQKVISLGHIFELLSKSGEYSQLEMNLLEFILKIYLTTEKKNEDFDTYLSDIKKAIDFKIGQLKEEISNKCVNFARVEKWIEFLRQYDDLYIEEKKNDSDSAGNKVKLFLLQVHEIWDKEYNIQFSENFYTNFNAICIKYGLDYRNDDRVELDFEPVLQTTEKKGQWESMLKNLEENRIKELIKQENNELLTVIKSIDSYDSKLDVDNIIESFIEFVSKALINKPPESVLHSVIKFLAEYIPNAIDNDKSQIKERKDIQDKLRDYKIVPIILDLLCEKTLNKKIFTILIHFCIKLLEGGNQIIQNDFYNYFTLFSKSENFFHRLHNMIKEHISLFTLNKENTSLNLSALKKSRKAVNNIIKLLQLFCENHFELLQNYIRVQEKSHNNYDLVVAVIVLLHELMRNNKKDDFLIVSKCFDTLTECIQGPCYSNQKAIINSKFLEIAGELLSIDEYSGELKIYEKLKKANKNNSDSVMGFDKTEFHQLPPQWMISHLKYKCMITVIGLLEGQSDNFILLRMVRTFNLLVFRENLLSIYGQKYKVQCKNDGYTKDLFDIFKHNEKYKPNKNDSDFKPAGKYDFIIEVGFLIYFLLKHFIDIEDKEIKKMLKTDIPEFEEMNSKLKQAYTQSKNSQKEKFKDFKTETKYFDDSDDICEALGFFEDNTGNVEIVFKGVLCVSYFWLPPVCHHLTYETREEFHSRVDRSSSKKKAEYLVSRAKEVIEDINYEEWLSTVYGYKLIGKHVRKLKFLAFLLSIILNLIILLSYNSFDGDRYINPQFGYFDRYSTENIWSSEKTNSIILGLGTIQAILSGLIFFFFIIKTAPILIKRFWKRQDPKSPEKKESLSTLKKLYQTIIHTLFNFDVFYHFFYFSFSILAITLHPFFYSAHLLDIMYRFPMLQGVVKSVVVPWRALLLTMVFIIVIVYLFSIWGYFRLHDSYLTLCDSLLICFVNNLDKGLKSYGGVGMWLDYAVLPKPTEIDIERFIFDNLFTIIIWLVMMNIVQGIIYIAFAVVRGIDDTNLNDLENICFICGKEKEIVERLTERSFIYHRLLEHNEWNYIFFLAYLEFKESTEHSGIESYVYELNKEMKIDWIPQEDCISFQIKDKQEENSLMESLNSANEELVKYQRILKNLKKSLNKDKGAK